MKRLLLLGILSAFVLAGCTEFEEPERIAETDDVVTSATAAPQTRAGAFLEF